MTYDLDNFEEQFNEKILNNGLKLFKSPYTQITKERNNIKFEYKKTIFDISIKRTGNKLHTNCSCKKLQCEHIAALLFFFNKDKFNLITKSRKKSLKSTFHKSSNFKTKLTIPELLAELDSKKLLQILNEIALKNENIDIQIRANFATSKNHSPYELLELKIQNVLFDNKENESESKIDTYHLTQIIIKLRENFAGTGIVKFYFNCAHILFNIYSKKQKHWLKVVVETFCDEAFSKVSISELKSNGFQLTELLDNYERKIKPNKDKLINRFYIRCLWAADSNVVAKSLNSFENAIIKQKQVWLDSKLNLNILQFILSHKKGSIKKNIETGLEIKLAATIALLEMEPKKANQLLMQLIHEGSNFIFSNYSISSRIYQLLKLHSLDVTLKVYLLTSFKTECDFKEDYLVEFDRLIKNKKERLQEIISIIDFWFALKNPMFINPILELSTRYQLKEMLLKILKSNIVAFTSFKKLLLSQNSFPFKEMEDIFIESIIRKVNQTTSNTSQERIFLELQEILIHLNIVNDKLFYKKLYNKRFQNNYFFKLVEKELE